ncbi:MAG TPA: hypothetical protein VL588_11435 [Bdellovibrionota bacterium]|jgi:hypothetical protein|nr:hypothetical protein [Bdellovibrionota bacterium]
MKWRSAKLSFWVAAAGLMVPAQAHAGDFYVETGVGAASIRNGQALFGGFMTAAPPLDIGLTLGFFYNLSSDSSDIQFHLGIKDRCTTGAASGLQQVLNIPYPVVARADFGRFYISAGVSPWVFTRQGSLMSLSYNQRTGGISLLGEAGLLWRVVPYFHLALELGTDWVKPGGSITGFSPSPAATLALQMRFFIGSGSGGPGDGKHKFDGWRYPFGIEIH